MSAFLKKLFKPKWQSNNAITRKEQIAKLDSSNDNDKSVLLKLASADSDNQVRRAAINQIDSVDALISLYKEQPDTLKPAIADRISTLSKLKSLPIYEIISDESVLVDFVLVAQDHAQFIPALGKLSSNAQQRIAIEAKHTDLRLAATELIDDDAILSAIEKGAKNKDKRVYQLAKAKLKTIKQNNKRSLALQQEKESLVKSLEDHANTESTALYGAKLSALLSAWNNLEGVTDEAMAQRYNRVKTACQLRAEQIKEALESSERAADQLRQQRDERAETLSTLEQTENRFKETAITSSSELSALDAIIKTQENRWLEATRNADVDSNSQKKYQRSMHQLKHYLKAAHHFINNTSEFLNIVEQPTQDLSYEDSQKTQQFIKEVDWPEAFKQPEPLKQLSKIVGAEIRQKKQPNKAPENYTANIDTLISRLEQALADRALKQSTQLHKELTHLIQSLDKAYSSAYVGRLQLLGKQLYELRDWQGFAVTPKQEELCENMTLLASQHLDPAAKAQKIKEMQDEWKRLGGAADQKLWLRFKSACDEAYEPCQHYFEEQRQLKKNNLEKRQKICQQLSDFVEQNDWENADWKGVENINRKAREEWKSCYPVEFKQNKSAQKAFNDLLSRIDQYLDEERSKNKQLKEQIVERAKALTTHEPISEAIGEVKKLQADWQKIGITLHKDDRKLWKDYRTACDQIFGMRETEREQRKQDSLEAIGLAQAVCDEAAASISTANQVTPSDIADFRRRLKENHALPRKESDAMSQQLEQHIAAIIAQQTSLAIEEKRLRWAGIAEKSKVIRDIAEKLNNGDDCELLISEKASLFTPSSNTMDTDLMLQGYWDLIISGQKIEQEATGTDAARALCIQCEIAAEIESPQEDKALRMQLQVNRLSRGINANEQKSKQSELTQSLHKWFEVVNISAPERAALEERIDKVVAEVTA